MKAQVSRELFIFLYRNRWRRGIVSCLPTGLPNSACKSITERMDGIPFKSIKEVQRFLKPIPNDGYLFSGWPNGSDELTTIVHFDADCFHYRFFFPHRSSRLNTESGLETITRRSSKSTNRC